MFEGPARFTQKVLSTFPPAVLAVNVYAKRVQQTLPSLLCVLSTRRFSRLHRERFTPPRRFAALQPGGLTPELSSTTVVRPIVQMIRTASFLPHSLGEPVYPHPEGLARIWGSGSAIDTAYHSPIHPSRRFFRNGFDES